MCIGAGTRFVWAAAAFAAIGLALAPVIRAENEPAAPTMTPAPVVPPTLRSLVRALNENPVELSPTLWRLLAAMARAHDRGIGPSEFLAAGYRAEQLTGAPAASVQSCLLMAWSKAQGMALFTPENLVLMEQGKSPRGVRGADRGLEVVIYGASSISVTMAATSDPLRPHSVEPLDTPIEMLRPRPAPPPRYEPSVPAPPPYLTVKELDVHLREPVSLAPYGLKTFTLRLDAVEHGVVHYFFEDSRAVHNALVQSYDPQFGVWKPRYQRVDNAFRTAAFPGRQIEGTKYKGVQLAANHFAWIYLDEEKHIDGYRLLIRVPTEVLNWDKLSPEEQARYEIPVAEPYIPNDGLTKPYVSSATPAPKLKK